MKKVAVIGAGASGLAAIKTCLENNLEVVCYEWNTDVGGIWCYKEKAIEGMGSVAKSTIINSSKELMAYSDFPPPSSLPNFMHHTELLQYLKLYAEYFNLIPFVKFRHRVLEVTPSTDYDESGKWIVGVLNEENGNRFNDEVNAVMVCTGHQGYPNRVEFRDQNKFCGNIIHSHEFKDLSMYENKKVLVVGSGNSAADDAVDLSYVAQKTYLSTRRGFWILRRTEECGKPYDFDFISRPFAAMIKYLPFNFTCWFIERKLNKWFNHEIYQLTPSHRVLSQFPTVNDFLPSRILSGRIIIKGNIERFTENGVIFENGESVEVDEVIMATGYNIKYPFLKSIRTDNNEVELYKYIFPPDMKYPTLGIIGCINALGGFCPVGEMQCRYFIEVLTNKIELPSVKEMKEDIIKKRNELKKTFYESIRHTIDAPLIEYLDELAALIGIKPNLFKLLYTDPILFKKLLLGPSLPYQYRLYGSYSWSGARKAILSMEERYLTPFRTRYKVENKKNFCSRIIIISLLVILFSILIKLMLQL
ncbi:dimethylaniline monooxygenase [N-oxide-forming] 5-like [Centruroides sculpturatus]|uniref:dimethylaniline monooxygenase [N-oxide-forming] 5-like n=1 Tax=Centruroides sculpturatus TaxID=218467 RepID=UPI000C6D40D0|nr:dimethylaniline monooxygenase [N-oxide-forming] 5-like [Centruroides sculpturatus]